MRVIAKTVAVLGLCCAVGAGAWGQEPVVNDLGKQKRTLTEIRKVGTALLNWSTDQVRGGTTSSPPTTDRQADSGWIVRDEKSDTESSYSLISHAAVTELLVPKYLDAVPENDHWGHAYQFALNVDQRGSNVVGVRSAGADGRFEGDAYVIGDYPFTQYDADIVWCDGYFARWPGRAD